MNPSKCRISPFIHSLTHSSIYQRAFSVKGKIANSLGFSGHMISVAATKFCHYRVKEPGTTHKLMGVTVSHYNLIFKNWLWAGFGLQAIVCRSQMACITLHALAVVKCSITIIAGWERAGEEACVWELRWHITVTNGTLLLYPSSWLPSSSGKKFKADVHPGRKKHPSHPESQFSFYSSQTPGMEAGTPSGHGGFLDTDARPRSLGPHQEESHCWWGLRGWTHLSWGWKMSNYDDLVSNVWL